MSTDGLTLDARQRAMLDEMGVKVWWPNAIVANAAVADAAPAEAAHERSGSSRPDASRADAVDRQPLRAAPPAPARAPAAVPPAAPARVAHGATVLVDLPQRLYGGSGVGEGGWLIVADMPPEADGRHGEPFAGDAGRLLDNMLRALQLHTGDAPVHLMRTHRGVASGSATGPQPFADGFAALAQPLAARVVLAMGPCAAQSLLHSSEPLGKLRGRAAPSEMLGAVPVVVTYHPAYLLRNPADKARAWADLCRAAAQRDAAASA